MNEKSITASSQGRSSIVAWPMIIASPLSLESSASARRSLYGRRSTKLSGSQSAALGLLDKGAWIGQLLDPLPRLHGEVIAAVRADVERRRELLVAEVRAAARAGVRCLRSGSGCGFLCSIETSIRSAMKRESTLGRGPARLRGARFSHVVGCGTKPVTPKPSTCVRSATSASSSELVEEQPVRHREEGEAVVRVEHVPVECDVRAVRALERPPDPAPPSARPVRAMNSSSGGSRSRAPTRATSLTATAPSSISVRSGMPHGLPDGELSGVFRSPWASSR